MKVVVKESGAVVASSCVHANSVATRIQGLLGRTTLPDGEGLLIDPCNNVHTFFMKFPIDVVFLDSSNVVVRVKELSPWRISPLVFSARRVLELPLGTARKHALAVGQRLEFEPCSN